MNGVRHWNLRLDYVSRPRHSWPRGLALLFVAFISASQLTSAVLFERVATRRGLQNGDAPPPGGRKGISWVVTNFPLRSRISCDPTNYHSPLVLNITRPDRSSFCFKVSSKMPDAIKYSCQQPPSASQVNRIQVLVADGCANAVVNATVDGRPWSYVTYDNASSILSIERIGSVPPPDATNPVDRTVCVYLRPDHETCGSVTSFCAPAYGPQPSCAVLVADSKGDCCPVNRVSYADANVEVAPQYRLYGKLPDGCESVTSEADLQNSLATQYRVALGLPAGSVEFQSYNCRASRMAAVLRINGLKLDEPELIVQRSAAILKPVASLVGLVGVRASYFNPSLVSPPPQARRQPTRVPQQLQQRVPPLSQLPPLAPDAASRAPPPSSSEPGQAPHYASKPPPVYGVY